MRVVLEHTQGPTPGLRQILGTLEGVCKVMGVETLPAYIGDVAFGNRTSSVTLVAARETYVLYRENPPVLPQGE